VIRRVLAWWRAYQRSIDLEILWPICKREAADLDHAKAAFAVHAFHDPAWLCLGAVAIIEAIEGLE
jgi:hypothetical protein